MFWHDGSSISNHSHILMTVSCIYDPATFLTDAEYQQKYGKLINVQPIVEAPYLYLLARCPSNDQQLMYVEERINDIKNLKTPLAVDGLLINDVMRIFKGDNPAAQFEAGHQKNGDYFCWQCPLYAQLSACVAHTMSLPNLNLNFKTA